MPVMPNSEKIRSVFCHITVIREYTWLINGGKEMVYTKTVQFEWQSHNIDKRDVEMCFLSSERLN
jgi:hypothetical protein